MTFPGVADEAQLATLTKMLDDLCRERDIANGDPAREDFGRLIMSLFNSNYSFAQIEQLLRSSAEKAA